MSWLGMGVTDGDEYAEAYERFMEQYDAGKNVGEITENIIGHYLSEFEADDGALHDVYFAVAKAQWMCCELSNEIFEKVSAIVDTGANIEFLRELGADESDLKKRRKNLQKFLDSLKIPRNKPRKRNAPPKEKLLPEVKPGEVFEYKDGDRKSLVIAVKKLNFPKCTPMLFCIIMKRKYSKIPNEKELLGEDIGMFAMFSADNFLPKSKLKTVCTIPGLNNVWDEWLKQQVFWGHRKYFFKDTTDKPSFPLKKLLESPKSDKEISIVNDFKCRSGFIVKVTEDGCVSVEIACCP